METASVLTRECGSSASQTRTGSAFPFAAMGSVHVENHITQFAPISVTDTSSVTNGLVVLKEQQAVGIAGEAFAGLHEYVHDFRERHIEGGAGFASRPD